MKPIDNRQNKLVQMKAAARHVPAPAAVRPAAPAVPSQESGIRKGGTVYGLVSNLLAASKIAQSAQHCHLAVHNFDKAEPLLAHAKQKLPALVILDWDGCEAEAFKLLKELGSCADLKGVPSVGYLSQTKAALKEEAQRAGCHRVYAKTEFLKELDGLLTRYAQ